MNINKPAENIVLPFTRARTAPPDAAPERHFRGINWMPQYIRNTFIAVLGEFVGTFLFLFFAFAAAQVSATAFAVSPLMRMLYSALGFAFSLLVNVWVFFRVSGGLFNPAVSPRAPDFSPLVSIAVY